MQTPTPSSHEGPLRRSKAFRRLTGAHAIMSSVVLADFAGFLLTLLIGVLMGSPIWWLLHVVAHLFHASLVFDIGLILILLCSAIGRFRQHTLRKSTELLLPFLARLLYDNNSSDHLVKTLFQLAHEGDAQWFCALFLMVPLAVAQKCEKRWEAMERDHVLDRDRFAYYCGQGKRLRRWLQFQQDALTQDELSDNAIPPLLERIDQLNSLIGREASQVKELRERLPIEPPKP